MSRLASTLALAVALAGAALSPAMAADSQEAAAACLAQGGDAQSCGATAAAQDQEDEASGDEEVLLALRKETNPRIMYCGYNPSSRVNHGACPYGYDCMPPQNAMPGASNQCVPWGHSCSLFNPCPPGQVCTPPAEAAPYGASNKCMPKPTPAPNENCIATDQYCYNPYTTPTLSSQCCNPACICMPLTSVNGQYSGCTLPGLHLKQEQNKTKAHTNVKA